MLACWLLLKQNQTKAFKLHRGSSIKTELWSTSFQIHGSVLGSSRRSLSLNETGHNGRSNWKMVTRLDFQVPHETCFVELAFDRSCTCPILTRKNRGFCFEMIKVDVEPPTVKAEISRWRWNSWRQSLPVLLSWFLSKRATTNNQTKVQNVRLKMRVCNSGDTLLWDNRRILCKPVIVLTRQARPNHD